MGPILALKYFRYTYRSSKINILQQAERLGGPIMSLGHIEPQSRSIEKDMVPLSISQSKNRSPVHEPLLADSPNATRRSFGQATPFDFFQSQSRLSSNYTRNCKDKWYFIPHSELCNFYTSIPYHTVGGSRCWVAFWTIGTYKCPYTLVG